MYYAFAREILDKCLELGILQGKDDGVFLYRAASRVDPENFPEGWYLAPKEKIIHLIMTYPDAIETLRPELEVKGYPFADREKYWNNMIGNMPKFY